MIQFDPPDLKERLEAACAHWAAAWGDVALDLPEDIEFFLEPDEDSVDFRVTEDSLIGWWLPESESAYLTCGEFLTLVDLHRQGVLIGTAVFASPGRFFFHLTPVSQEAHRAAYEGFDLPFDRPGTEKETTESDPDNDKAFPVYHTNQGERSRVLRRHLQGAVQIGDVEAKYAVTSGLTPFALGLVSEGLYAEYLPPLTDEDVFVEVWGPPELSLEDAQHVASALLFELSSSLDLTFHLAERPVPAEGEWWESESKLAEGEPRLRPLLMGRGLSTTLALYMRASASEDVEVRVLRFAQVIEHVSQTVVRKASTAEIRQALLAPEALAPDADFIRRLEAVVKRQQQTAKDAEAMRRAILECCDPVAMAPLAPPCLKGLAAVDAGSSSKQREGALERLAQVVVATRNAIAHAKANYSPTGLECPADQLPALGDVLQVAAQQVIRWFGAQAAADRVIG